MRVTIYALLNSRGSPFYVGRTTQLDIRLRNHRLRYGRKTTAKILQECEEEDAAPTETWWINFYRGRGHTILNTSSRRTNGGVIKHTKKTRQKMAAAQRGNRNTLGHRLSAEHKQKIVASLIGNTRSVGRKLTPEHVAALHEGRRKQAARNRGVRRED